MTSEMIITREQYLQQRKDAAKVSRRKIILPGFLFIIPLITLITLFKKERPPTSLNEHILFWLLCCIILIGMIWCYWRMFADAKLNAVHCLACGKNNGGHKASRWLIASGNCIKCGEKMLADEPSLIATSDETTSISRADYQERLQRVEHSFLRASMYVCVPLLVALIWLAQQYTSPTGPEPYHDGLLLAAFGIAAIVLLLIYERHLDCSQIKCPKCSSNPLRNGSAKIVLATGCCAKCGNPMALAHLEAQ
jgi:hypothetical protein